MSKAPKRFDLPVRLNTVMTQENVRTAESPAPESFEALCHRVHPRLVRSLALYCGDARTGEDLAQEALALAFRDWSTVKQTDHPEAWVHRVGMNLAHSWFRRARIGRERTQPTDPDRPDEPETRLTVRAAVASLPRRQRQALVLRYFVDLSIRDTATAMQCAEGTVRALSSQAIDALRQKLGDTWEVEG